VNGHWFELWDQEKGDLVPSGILSCVSSIEQLDGQKAMVHDGDW
jgi:hypothetical protein